MSARIGLISYGANRPKSGITRYTQEIAARIEQHLPLTVLHAGHVKSPSGLVPLRGAARIPGLLTLGQAEIAWQVRQHQLELVHDPTGLAPLAIAGVPTVSTIHDVISFIHPDASTRLNRLITRHWLVNVAPRLDAVITDSRQSRDDIVEYLGVDAERVTVIPLGVNFRFAPVDESESNLVLERLGISFPYILYVSAVEPRKKRKNLPRLLEAYARLRHWSTEWRLVVAGSVRRDYAPVFETIERLRLADKVHFTGFVDEEDLPSLYSRAALFVMPSLYEGFGFPVLEAMACGTPVVTSNTSSLPEVACCAALLVDPCSVEAIEDAMRRVLSSPALAAKMSADGIQRASQFTWQRTAMETIAVYERILGRAIIPEVPC